jgi:hypothetical protein
MLGVPNPNLVVGFVARRRHSPNFAPHPKPAIGFGTLCIHVAAAGDRARPFGARTDAGEIHHVRGLANGGTEAEGRDDGCGRPRGRSVVSGTRLLLTRRSYVTRRHPHVTFRAPRSDVMNPIRAYDGFDSSRHQLPPERRLEAPPERRLEAFSRAHDDRGLPGEHDLAPLLVSTGATGDRPHLAPDPAESLISSGRLPTCPDSDRRTRSRPERLRRSGPDPPG